MQDFQVPESCSQTVNEVRNLEILGKSVNMEREKKKMRILVAGRRY